VIALDEPPHLDKSLLDERVSGVTGHSIPRHQTIPRVKPGYTPGMNWPRLDYTH